MIKEDDLQAVITDLKAELLYRLDRPSRIAGTIGYYHLKGGDYKLLFEYFEKLSSLSSDDIRNAAKKYFNKQNRTVVKLVPKQNE